MHGLPLTVPEQQRHKRTLDCPTGVPSPVASSSISYSFLTNLGDWLYSFSGIPNKTRGILSKSGDRPVLNQH
jgi:hypothetical protein